MVDQLLGDDELAAIDAYWRFHLVMDVIDRVPSLGSRAATLRQQMSDARLLARKYTRDTGIRQPGGGTPGRSVA
jgi:phosphoketolase